MGNKKKRFILYIAFCLLDVDEPVTLDSIFSDTQMESETDILSTPSTFIRKVDTISLPLNDDKQLPMSISDDYYGLL